MICSGVRPRLSASALAVPISRSVWNGPGNSPLMVTLLITVLRDRAGDEAGEARARAIAEAEDLDRRLHRGGGDVDDAAELARHHPSTVALISSIGVSMLASIALIQSSRVQLRKSPGGGPPALFTRMSGSGQAFSTALAAGLCGDVADDFGHRHGRVGLADLGGGFPPAPRRRARSP